MSIKRILFVCMGNICRSPAAEAVMKKMIANEKLSKLIEVDSAGIIDYHKGETADPRIIRTATKRGYKVESVSRQFDMNSDFENFDYIVAMDNENFDDILALDMDNKYHDKVLKFTDFLEKYQQEEIPDPYYNGIKGFELVLELIEDASKGLLKKVKDDIQKENQTKD